jgi:hypothetical protein
MESHVWKEHAQNALAEIVEAGMKQLIPAFLAIFVGGSVAADTTNRALQVSPVPGLFVGGVGLLCLADDQAIGSRQYFLLTKSREIFGWARFDKDDDIRYETFDVGKFPDHYRVANDAVEIAVNRKSLRLTMDRMEAKTAYNCEATSITDLHNAAKVELRKLLKGNKI